MYISPFWCGVIATVLAEIIAVIFMLVWLTIRYRGNNDEEYEENDSDREN